MDVKYIPEDWEKMKSGIGNLIGLGVWGKGMVDNLKDVTKNLEDAESDIAKFDSDGVISFSHINRENNYQKLFDDFQVLHTFSGKVGDIVDRTIDQPFYEDIDAFVAKMQEATISKYTTDNRIGATEEQVIYQGYGNYATQQTTEVPKAEVGLDDIFSGDNHYADQMKLEFEAWEKENPDQDFSQEDYQMAAVNMHAFEYDSIKDQQLNKEFWVNIGALVVIVGATVIFPPAGLALAATYGTLELGSAISGEDWASQRELGSGERWIRGALSPLDLVPGVAGVTKFSSAVRAANLGTEMGQFGLKTGMKTSIQRGISHVDDIVVTAGKQTTARLKSAKSAIQDTTKVAKEKLATGAMGAGKLADSAVTQAKNINPSRRMVAMDQVGNVHMPAENTHFFESQIKNTLNKAEGVNIVEAKKISKTDKAKIDKWSYRPSDEKYLKQKEVFDNPNYYNQETGDINWPPHDGFDGETKKMMLEEGTLIDRYGEAGGSFFSPEGIPYEQRALALHSDEANYYVYRVTDSLEVDGGKIAPWFGREGGGTQFVKYHDNGEMYSMQELINDDYIELVSANKGGGK